MRTAAALQLVLFAVKDLRGRRLRSAIATGTLALAVAGLLLLVSVLRSFRELLAGEARFFGYEAVVVAPGCPYEMISASLAGGGGLPTLDEALRERIEDLPSVDGVSPFLLAVLPYGGAGWLSVEAVDPEAWRGWNPDLRLGRDLATGAVLGRWFREGGEVIEAIAGFEAAMAAGWEPGTVIRAGGDAIQIVGILARRGGREDGLLHVPLEDAQRMLRSEGRVTGFGLRLASTARMEDLRRESDGVGGIQILDPHAARRGVAEVLESTGSLLWWIVVLAAVVAGAGVAQVFWLSTVERLEELALWRAMGAGTRLVCGLLWLQAALLGLAGGAFGATLAWLLRGSGEELLNRLFLYGGKVGLEGPPIEMWIAATLGCAAFSALVGTPAALRASLLQPIDAFRARG